MFATKAFKFAVKASADKAGQFSGRASVYGVVDSYNDVVMPGAFTKYLAESGSRIRVLNQHNPMDPIGFADLSDSDTALLAAGQLVLDLPTAKDMYTRLQNDLIDAMSIGYEVLDEAYSNGVRQLKEIKLWEISLVTFPANTFARVTDVKTDIAHLVRGKDIDPKVVRMLQGTASLITSDLIEALVDSKAGRVLSDTNRKKVQNAHDTLTEATSILQELLEMTDPNADKHNMDLETLLSSLRQLDAEVKRAA